MNRSDTNTTIEKTLSIQTRDIFALHRRMEEMTREIELLKEQVKEAKEERSGRREAYEKKKIQFWGEAEHARFVQALEIYGKKNVREIALYLGTRTPAQVRSHMQKYFIGLEKNEPKKSARKKKNENANANVDTERVVMVLPPPLSDSDVSHDASTNAEDDRCEYQRNRE
jgi:SHAQKYF class myb-like DNA-binding protein